MIKSHVNGATWLVTQPDHARLSAYLAAHWGGTNGFLCAGAMDGAGGGSDVDDRVREAVLMAIAEHDNGWQEWEATPLIDEQDGLPVSFLGLSVESPREGLDRWRRGVERFAERSPYAALLISLHMHWLYAWDIDDPPGGRDERFRYPLFSSANEPRTDDDDALPGSEESVEPAPDETQAEHDRAVRRLLAEQAKKRALMMARISGMGPPWPRALEDDVLGPHVRLLQAMDAMSLLLCFGAPKAMTLPAMPRAGMKDAVELAWRPTGQDGRVIVEPYPFDADPLPVEVSLRIVEAGDAMSDAASFDDAAARSRLHRLPMTTARFELASG